MTPQQMLDVLNYLNGQVGTGREPETADLLPIIKELLFRVNNLENHVLPPEGGVHYRLSEPQKEKAK